jgi:1-phosphofructokinase
VLKVSHEELGRDGLAADDSLPTLLRAMERLIERGAGAVAVTRAEAVALALLGGRAIEVRSPKVSAVEPRGAGDSFTAGLVAGLAHGEHLEEALRRGAAAGALNVSRRGLGTGRRDQVEQVMAAVEIRPL